MFCSTIIPTIARPTVERAVRSVLDQDFTEDGFEVVVVNDSGAPLPAADWQQDPRVRVIDTQRRERIFARNSGAAVARGRYLNFLDDDDWLLPGALRSIWQLAGSLPPGSRAHWLYGGSQLVDRAGNPLLQLHHGMQGNSYVQIMAGEWIPLQSSFIDAGAFFAVGGFTPGVLATQDVDLCRRIALHGDLAGTRALVSCIGMGTQGSSTDYDRAPQYSRWAREKILDQPGVFARLRSSDPGPYWRGRITRLYATSLIWNLRHARPFTALSRGLYTLASLFVAGPALLAGEYWKAVRSAYQSETFSRGRQEASARPGYHEPARTGSSEASGS